MTKPEVEGELTAEQQDTVILLDQLLGRAISDRYVDFCRLASGLVDLRVSRPVAAHALRELDSMLRSALVVPMEVKAAASLIAPGQFVQAKAALEALGFEGPAAEKAVLALKPRVNHANAIRQITDRLGLASDGDVARAWIALTAAFGRAHERSFHRSLKVDDEFRKKFQHPFDMVIRAVALAMQRRYSALMKRVEEITLMRDKGHAVSLFEEEIPGALPLQWHFFERLQTADWLAPLVRRNLVGPPLSESIGGGLSRSREWPASNYLRRMAESLDPDVRRQVATAIRDVASSKHPDVSRGGMEAIAALPAADAASLVDVAYGWLERDASFMTIQAAEQLVKNLAEGGEGTAALTTASRLLQVFGKDGEVASLYEQSLYEYSLPTLVQILTKACGIAALELFTALLNASIVVGHERNQDSLFDRTAYDQGALADESIESHDIYTALRSEVRRSAEMLVDSDPTHLPAILKVFEKYAPKLFRRLEIFVLSKDPSVLPATSTATLLNVELIGSSWCAHEYAGLARAWFPSMHPRDQEAVLDLLDAVPGRYVEGWRKRFGEHEKRQPTLEDEHVYNAHVIRDAVWHWRSVLPADRRLAVEAIGDPDSWKQSHWMRGEESPLTDADFTAQTPAQIAAYLRTWQSDAEPRRHTVSALALELRNAAARDPAKYAEAAMEFADAVPAVYVHRMLEGLGDAARNQHDFSWSMVLSLLDATFARWEQSVDPLSIPEGNDPNWQWACAAGVHLLKAGLQRGAKGIPFEHRCAVQRLILSLQQRAPRAPEHEGFERQFARDPFFAAESTLRGSAVELGILLIFWLSKELGSTISAAPREALAMTPKISDAFDAELADETSSGRIPRAVLGRYLQWLFYFGEGWLIERMDSIFPQNDELRRAAWLGHLLHDGGPRGELLESLQQDYSRSIDELTGETRDRDDQVPKSLGNHLLVLYLQGHLNLEPGGLLDRFLLKASPRLRQHLMWSLGMHLQQPLDQFPEAMRERSIAYWDSRLTAGEAAQDRSSFQGELGSIGQWCERRQIDPDWLFEQLLRMTRSGFSPSITHNVVEWLAKVSETHVDRAVEVLEALVTSPGVDRYMGKEQSIRTILTGGHTRGTSTTIGRVGEVVSFLASIGQTFYLDVAQPTQVA